MSIKISKNRLDMGSTPIKNVSYQDLDQVATQAAPAASKTRLYSKTDGALYVVPAAGSETAAGVPANGIIHTTATTAPTGWTEFTAGRGRVIVGTPSGGTHAGTVGTALTNLEDPTHTHTVGIPFNGWSNSGTQGADIIASGSGSSASIAGTRQISSSSTSAITPYIQQLGIIKS